MIPERSMAGEIRVVSTSLVQARNNKQQRIELTPCDIVCLTVGPIQRGLLFLKPNPSETDELLFDGRSFVEHLQNSLSATLDFYFPLAGRLATVEHDGGDSGETLSFFIDCNNEGARFVHAVADHVRVADILEPIYVPPFVHSFFILNWGLGHDGVSKPLLGVQVTELVDGIFIGCTMNHSVADGFSFWNFINSWSEISRGSNRIANPPVFDRPPSLFGSTDELEIRIPSSLIKTEVEEFIPPPPLQLQERFFHFSKPKIAELKAKANADQAGGSANISSLQSVLAHIWRSAIRNGGVNPDGEPISLFYAIGIRARIDPHFPELYFGNAFLAEKASLKEQDLIEQGLGYAAVQIYKKVGLYTGEKIKSCLQDWVQNPKLSNLASIAKTLLVASSPRYNVYGNDFGWGKPIAVRTGSVIKIAWSLTLFQGVEEGSIDVEVSISPQVLEAMGNDLEFMDAVTL